MMLIHVGFIILSILSMNISTANKCCQVLNRDAPKFRLVRHYSRSTKAILLEKMFSTVEQCEKFAVLKKALAYNFQSLNVSSNTKTKIDKIYHHCQVLGCPETNLAQMLVHDKKFSYYSLYSRRRMPGNVSIICLPKVGLFVGVQKYENYSNAQAECTKMNGKLAHIISAERSEGLSKYIGETPTFIGLSNQDRDHTWKNEFGEPLSCFRYRAWGHREPSSRGCVALTHSTTQSSYPLAFSWKVVPCSHSLPFICEILPNFS